MRTVEVGLGLLLVAAAVALAFGAAALVVPIPPPGIGMTLALAALGTTIAAHGMAGRARHTDAPGTASLWRALFYALLILTLAASLPLTVEWLDLISVAGFPLGFFAAAQGLLLVFAILGFRAAMHLDVLDKNPLPAPAGEDV
jgi:putative solute:sodium symporter small subunit